MLNCKQHIQCNVFDSKKAKNQTLSVIEGKVVEDESFIWSHAGEMTVLHCFVTCKTQTIDMNIQRTHAR